jgi:hypothetical protein
MVPLHVWMIPSMKDMSVDRGCWHLHILMTLLQKPLINKDIFEWLGSCWWWCYNCCNSKGTSNIASRFMVTHLMCQ